MEQAGLLGDHLKGERGGDSGTRRADEAASLDDRAVVAQVRDNGSKVHFRLLVQRHQKHVHDLVSSVLGPRYRDLADETAQDAFVKIFTRLHTFEGDAKFSSWAYRIAYNAALDQLRKIKRQRTVPLDARAESHSAGESPDRAMAQGADRVLVRSAVEQLPDIYRAMIHLHYWRGLSMTEIAEVLDSTPGTVKSYLHRARERLKQLLGDNHELP